MVAEFVIAERQQVGLNYLHIGVLRDVSAELVGGSHYGADAGAATQKLLQDALTSAPGATN
jgi:hypothetical protein